MIGTYEAIVHYPTVPDVINTNPMEEIFLTSIPTQERVAFKGLGLMTGVVVGEGELAPGTVQQSVSKPIIGFVNSRRGGVDTFEPLVPWVCRFEHMQAIADFNGGLIHCFVGPQITIPEPNQLNDEQA